MLDQWISTRALINALVFSGIGLVVLAIAFEVFDKITPGNLWKEIFEEQNIAVAITVGAMALAISQIIASSVHG